MASPFLIHYCLAEILQTEFICHVILWILNKALVICPHTQGKAHKLKACIESLPLQFLYNPLWKGCQFQTSKGSMKNDAVLKF